MWNIESVAKRDDRSDIAANANQTLTTLLRDATWATQESWQLNQFHCRHLLALTAYLLSDDHVQARLTEALEVTPTLLPDILVGLAQWAESRDFDDFNTVLGVTCAIKEIPLWIPTDVLVRRIRAEIEMSARTTTTALAPILDTGREHPALAVTAPFPKPGTDRN